MLSGKSILLIGGSGTLGQALTDELLKQGVSSIRIYARNEYKIFQMRQKYGEPTEVMRYFIGDIRDKNRLDMAMKDVGICINCAAIKHVSLANENPFETIRTNVLGVQNALECAVENDIEAFIQISTDKAVNPVNLYGCTKATAEYLVLDSPNWQGKNTTRFTVIRSGNIKASSGSVLEIWRKQFENGETLTVTDPNAERYMASKENIARTIIKTIADKLQGLVVLDMPRYKVSDLLKEFEGCKWRITGLKPGEKLREELYREGEKFTLVNVP